MAFELVYTSAPAGIEPGSSGFCTVAATRGIPRSLIRLLESLTAYNPIFAHYTQEAAKNPVANLHCVIDSYHIFARLHGAGLDYTGRSNKFADFLIFSDAELRRTNTTPADVFKLAPSPFRESWSGPPDPDLPEPVLPDCPHRDDPAYIWQQCCGDAACAAILASYARTNPGTPLHILFDPLRLPTPDCTGKLAAEAIALLEPENARRVTFHSCFTQNAPPGILIQWRFIPLQSEMASKVRNNPRLTVFDLAQMPTLLQSSDHHFTRLAERARSGRIDMPVPPRPPAPPVQNVVSTAPGGHAAEFEFDREAPLFKFQPKRPKPPETCEEDGAAATPKRGHQIFFILGLIVLIAVVMGGVVLFNTPFEDLQKIRDSWKRPDSSAAITSDLDVTEDHVDEPESYTPPPEDTEPGEGVSLSRPEEAKEPAAQFPERDKAEPRNLTAEIPSAVPGAGVGGEVPAGAWAPISAPFGARGRLLGSMRSSTSPSSEVRIQASRK